MISHWKKFDEQTKKCYYAENVGDTTSIATFKSNQEVLEFLSDVIQTKVWKKIHKKKKLNVIWLSPKTKYPRGGRTKDGKPVIYIPQNRFGRNVHSLIHEISHTLAPHINHDKYFITIMLYLMEYFEGSHYSQMLEMRLKETGALAA